MNKDKYQLKLATFIEINLNLMYNLWSSYFAVKCRNLQQNHPKLELIRVLSDGCAQQFKNKYNLWNLVYAKKDFGVALEWYFSAISHGKSSADGLDGLKTFKT